MTIVIADDSATMRHIVSSILRAKGFDSVVAVENGDQVVDLAVNNPDIGLIILDWKMPGIDGIDCLKILKNDERTRAIPVMMVTSEATDEGKAEAAALGAEGYVTKPFDPDELMSAITRILN